MRQFSWAKADFRFYRLPAALWTDDRYSGMSLAAKVLYAMLISRAELSEKNKWTDERGVYVNCTVETAGELLGCKHCKATGVIKELADCGLIAKHRQFSNATRLYVLPFEGVEVRSDSKLKIENKPSDEPTEYITEEKLDDALEWAKSLFYDPSSDGTTYAVEMPPVIRLIADTVATDKPYVKIGNQNIAVAKVKERFGMLDNQTVYKIIDKMLADGDKICNRRAYLLTALYNEACDYV